MGWGKGEIRRGAGGVCQIGLSARQSQASARQLQGLDCQSAGVSREGRGACSYILEKPFLFAVWRGARAQGYVVGTWMENWLKGLKHAPIIYVCMPLEKCFNPSALVPNPLEIGGKVAEGFLKVRFLAKPK